MKTEFSSRVRNLRSSVVRDILSFHGHPDLISFAGGLPGARSLPLEEMKASAERVFEGEGSASLQYGTSEGYPPLRQWIAADLTREGVPTTPEEILITSGSQQALDLLSRLFIDRGDSIAVELPCYGGALQAFQLNEAAIRPLPCDEEGPLPDAMEAIIAQTGTKLCYLTPTLQNPSGKSYSLRRRKEMAAILDRSSVWFVEDDPYGKLIFEGQRIPGISSFMKSPSISTGSFSKIISPSLRVGYLRAPVSLITRLTPVKQALDLHTSLLSQMILHAYLRDYPLEEHLQSLRMEYRTKRDRMLRTIEETDLPARPERIPEGGMFLWLRFAKGISTDALAREALKEGVAIVPGSSFYADRGGDSFARLNYTAVEEDKIQEGITRLAKAVRRLSSVEATSKLKM